MQPLLQCGHINKVPLGSAVSKFQTLGESKIRSTCNKGQRENCHRLSGQRYVLFRPLLTQWRNARCAPVSAKLRAPKQLGPLGAPTNKRFLIIALLMLVNVV